MAHRRSISSLVRAASRSNCSRASCKQQYDLIFADPPYALPTLPTIPQLILGKGMLRPGGLLVFEHGKHNDFSDVPGFIEHRAYGSVNFSLFRAPEDTTEEA